MLASNRVECCPERFQMQVATITGTTRGYPFGLGVIGHGQNPPTPLKMRFKRVLWINLTKLCKTRLNLVKTHLNGF